MLELKDIYYRPATSRFPILNGLSLSVINGIPAVVAGSSGCGKTSLIEVVSGIAKQEKGNVIWNNKPLNPRQRRWLCGVVFQFPERHFLGLTVAQELRLGHKRLSSQEQTNSLKEVGLPDIDLRLAPEKLSGGQQRRLALAVQLLRKPKVLLLDEPTAGLDWSVKDEILELLAKLSKSKFLIIVTHEPELFKSWNANRYELRGGNLSIMKRSD
ncbi:ABC transporter ATP-binding protein [Prochlorococcus sp. MIT 1341]|uniref:ABC transporter ATP-binding protein n=1 Tax=Prochlorococcus sp. MIT 1341 TaxID=3096221 RepID=UPI002A75D0BB|nr:ABC transporter ATP-binding protein [Prochlorococcus sp. MIT 1341]